MDAEVNRGTHDYNYTGMRIRHLNSDRGDIEYIYDDNSIIDEVQNGTTTSVAHYRYGDRLLSLDSSGQEQFYHYASLGTTANLSDSSGAVQVSYRVDPFGEITEQEGVSVNRQVFTGHEHDEETGLIYMKARFYDPDVGRFLNQDTYLGENGTPPSLHRYLYAYSSPTVYWDPDGYAAVLDPDQIDFHSRHNKADSGDVKKFADHFGENTYNNRRGFRKFTDHGSFVDNVRNAAGNSKTPAIMLVEKGDTSEDLLGLAYETLGDRLTPQQKQELKGQIETARPGSIINMSGYMEGATKSSYAANDNFLSDFHRDMDALTDETSFLEEPGAHITSAWLTVGESIGRSFETAVDSGSPQHVRRKAQGEAALEVVTTVVPIGKLKHLKHAKKQKVTKSPASRLADKAQSLPGKQRPNTVAVIKHMDGSVTVGRNQGGVQNSAIQNALDNAPSNCFAGQCAEINALSRALNKGRSLDGATISVSNVRGPASTSGIHGTPKAPCTTCANVLDQLNVGQ